MYMYIYIQLPSAIPATALGMFGWLGGDASTWWSRTRTRP